MLVLATAAGCSSTPDTGTDASTRMDAAVSTDTGTTNRVDSRITTRADARVMMAPDAARPAADAGRAGSQPRDAGGAAAGMPYVPPTGDRRIFSRFANQHCFSYWDEPNNEDDTRVYLTACIPVGEGAGNQAWELRPVEGRPGAVTIRTLRDSWDANDGCWTIDTEDQIRASTCSAPLAVWNVRVDADSGEIQLASQERPGQCLYAVEGVFAELADCGNDAGQYFDTRPYNP
jgi:hypothetical protein